MNSENTMVVLPHRLRALVTDIFTHCGTPEEEAAVIADSLVHADLVGRQSHGVTRVKLYTDMIRAGGAAAACRMELVRDFPGGALIDARGSLGIPVSWYAMKLAIEKAEATGIAMVNVLHSNHCGASGYFTNMAAEAQMIGIACSNAPSSMAPWGAGDKYLGTNPLAISVPTGTAPLELDMATSVVARGKILLAAKEGRQIPENWAIDAEGRPTRNAEAALQGCVLPFGGAKGSGISMMIDILAGVLSGGAYGSHMNNPMRTPERPMDVAHTYAAIRIAAFRPYEAFLEEMDRMAAEIKSLRPASGFQEVLLPGEPERRNEARSQRDGIALPVSVYRELQEIAHERGLPFDILQEGQSDYL